MKILALDSAMNGCSAALLDTRTDTACEQTMRMTRGQAEHLMPLIESVLQEAQTPYQDIDMIAVTRGPGAFTGMRIGIATAKALALSLNKPLVGVSTFEAILYSYASHNALVEGQHYAVILETKRKDYYFQLFYCDSEATGECKPVTEMASFFADDIEEIIQKKRPRILLGDAQDRYANETENIAHNYEEISLPLSSIVAKRAYLSYKNEEGAKECLPIYIRDPDVSMPKSPIRKIRQ